MQIDRSRLLRLEAFPPCDTSSRYQRELSGTGTNASKKEFHVQAPYQPTSGKLWNSSVIFGMAVAIIELSVPKLVLQFHPFPSRVVAPRRTEGHAKHAQAQG